MGTLDFLKEAFSRLVETAYEQNKLSKTCCERLKSKPTDELDDLEIAFNEFIYYFKHSEFYITLDRIEKGEEMLAAETDEAKKAEYRKLLHQLTVKLESLTPKEESA